MSLYRAALNHDRPFVDLFIFRPQPRGTLVQPVQRGYGANGTVHDQGGFCIWTWEIVVDQETDYQSLIANFGLDNADEREVTIYTKSGRMVWTRYNAIAQLPEPNIDVKYERGMPRDVQIHFTDLEAIG